MHCFALSGKRLWLIMKKNKFPTEGLVFVPYFSGAREPPPALPSKKKKRCTGKKMGKMGKFSVPSLFFSHA
jgi:hypothetical protein